jgi:branched-subunit amino acid transport protein
VSAVWICVIVVGMATIAVKAGGPVLAAGRELPQGVARVVDLLAPALLAALVATQALADGKHLGFGTDTVGVLAGGAVAWKTGSIIGCVIVAAAVTAGLRAL